MQLRFFAPVAFALTVAAGFSTSASAADPSGVWAKEDGSAKIEVTKCGRGLCSKIIWLAAPNDTRGKPLRDGRNENVSLRTRPIIGLSLFSRMAPSGANSWVGTVYNPEEGKSYADVTVTLVSSRQIVLRGCKMLFCREKIWTRTSAPEPVAPPAGDDDVRTIEVKAEPNATEPKAAEPKAEQQEARAQKPKSTIANAAYVPDVEQHAPQAYIAPGVVATTAKADPLPLSGEDVPSMMVMNKPAAETAAVATDGPAAMEAAAAEGAMPPVPVKKAKPKPQVAQKPAAPERVATTAPVGSAVIPVKPPVRVVQEPQERLPWQRPQGYAPSYMAPPSYLGSDQAPPPRRGIFGGLFR